MTVKKDATVEVDMRPKKAKAKPGRKRDSNYLTFEEAREFIQSEMIPSRNKYEEWYAINKPKQLPRFPYRVYTEGWKGWNDFLGNENEFNAGKQKPWRDMIQATAWAHQQKIATAAAWMAWAKVEGNLPDDIPARPDLVYKTWKSWNHFLGNTPVAAIEARRETQKIQVYYIIHMPETPQNILWFGVDPTLTSVKERWEKSKCDIVKLFWYDHEKANTIKSIVDQLSSPYQDSERQRLVPNVWEIVYNLQMHLQTVTPADTR